MASAVAEELAAFAFSNFLVAINIGASSVTGKTHGFVELLMSGCFGGIVGKMEDGENVQTSSSPLQFIAVRTGNHHEKPA